MSRALVWFRNDQRLADNHALSAAINAHDEVLPVLVLDPRQFGASAFGFERCGVFRRQFLLEGILDLDAQLREKGSALHVRVGAPDQALLDTARNWGADHVYAQRLCAWEEQEQERAVAAALTLHLHEPNTMLAPDDLPFALSQLPMVFTDFRRRVEKDCTVRTPLPEPYHVPSPSGWSGRLPVAGILERLHVALDRRAVMRFAGGRAAALKRLEHYVWGSRSVAHYKSTRNALLGADNSSKLSPWLATGALGAREIWHAVKQYEAKHGSNESTYWLGFELLWRDFFQFTTAKHGRALFLKKGIAQRPTDDDADQQRFDAWRTGRTGQPFIDANMRELAATGWMSNRGRQNAASFLVHDLGIDWRMGASWFERQLIDYDPCSNWGNWQYVAGVGNDPRQGRRFNPETQAAQYDADGAYVRTWLD